MKSTPKISWKACSIPKQGNTAAENEDSYLPAGSGEILAGRTEFVCAVADGATQTSFSALWSRLLVQEAVSRSYPSLDLPALVSCAETHWSGEISKIQLPWHAEEKVRQGAFSTLLWFGLRINGRTAKQNGVWRAVAVGDSCIFQIRKGTPIAMFPRLAYSDFGRNPVLFSSSSERNVDLLSRAKSCQLDGAWSAGDEFLLMTDALAAWFVREQEKGSAPFSSLQSHFLAPSATQATLTEWVREQRAARALKNDDTTLVWVKPEGKFTLNVTL
jgi:hypothetical protein